MYLYFTAVTDKTMDFKMLPDKIIIISGREVVLHFTRIVFKIKFQGN